jgi:hypothetical protein
MMPQETHDAPPESSPVTTVARRLDELSQADFDRLFELMSEHFAGIDRGHFEHDLREKEWVFLVLEHGTERIVGFSTLMSLRTELDGEPLVAWFTGDTVIAPEHWGDRGFIRTVGKHMFALRKSLHDGPVYWVLLTCTNRSYRLMPGMFETYHPRRDTPTSPELLRKLEKLVRMKFPDEYDAEKTVVALKEPTPVQGDRAAISDRHLADPEVAFFVQANPGYARGDYLACFTLLSYDNVNRLGRRIWSVEPD